MTAAKRWQRRLCGQRCADDGDDENDLDFDIHDDDDDDIVGELQHLQEQIAVAGTRADEVGVAAGADDGFRGIVADADKSLRLVL